MSNGYVGIGTNNPGTLLHLYDPTSAANPILAMQTAANSIFGLQVVENSGIRIGALSGNNLKDSLVVHKDGNVGIGTNNPLSPLHVESSGTWSQFRIGKIITEPDTAHGCDIFKPASSILYAQDQTGKYNYGGDFYLQIGGLNHYSWNAYNYGGALVLRAGNVWSKGNNGASTGGHELGGDVYLDSGALHTLNNGGSGPAKRGGDIHIRTGDVKNFSSVAAMESTSVSYTSRIFVAGHSGAVGINTTYSDGDLCIGCSNPTSNPNTYITIGNVGMGTAADTTTFGLERSRSEIRFRSWRDAIPHRLGAKIVSISKQTYGDPTYQHLVQSSDLLFCTAPPYGLAPEYDQTVERMRIMDNGNVGIGIVNPEHLFQVGGNIGIAANLSNNVVVFHIKNTYNSNANNLVMFQNSSNRAEDGGPSCATLRNDAGRLRLQGADGYNNFKGITIESDGRVGIGAPPAEVTLYVSGISYYSPNGSWIGGSGTYTGFGASLITTAGIWSQSYGIIVSSDQRIKKDISLVHNVLETISNIEVVSYKHIDHEAGKDVAYGVVAQQLLQHTPECVSFMKNFIPCVYRNGEHQEVSPNSVRVYSDFSHPDIKVGSKLKIYILKDDKKDAKEVIIQDFSLQYAHVDKWDGYSLYDKIFVYGIEVDDFMCVEKEQLAILSLAGVKDLISENTFLKSQVASLSDRLSRLEALLSR